MKHTVEKVKLSNGAEGLLIDIPDASVMTFEFNFRDGKYRDWETDRKSTRLNSSHITRSRMPSSA